MMEVPSTEWREGEIPDLACAVADTPVRATGWRVLRGVVRHSFTHFHLEVAVASGKAKGSAPRDCIWCPPDSFGDYALPTVMKKMVRHVLLAGEEA
jgi:A/G-specific adenine glycosylase